MEFGKQEKKQIGPIMTTLLLASISLASGVVVFVLTRVVA